MRRTTTALVAACALTAAGLFAAPAAPAAEPDSSGIDYVALGDSYSAGPLIAPPPGRSVVRTDPIECARSWNNYPAFLAGYLDVASYTDVTCSGARTTDFLTPQGGDDPYAAAQVDALTADTDLVTITIGGNDNGLFGSIIDTCGVLAEQHPHAVTPCRAHFTVDGVDTKARDARAMRATIADTVAAVREAAPNAAVYVLGYPRLMPPGARTCDAVGFAAGDVAWGNRIEHLLNRALRTGSTAAGAAYVGLYPTTRGHDACAGGRAWINGASIVWSGPKAGANFHPNRSGERAMARAVFHAVTGQPAGSAPSGTDAAPPADAIVVNPAYPG